MLLTGLLVTSQTSCSLVMHGNRFSLSSDRLQAVYLSFAHTLPG